MIELSTAAVTDWLDNGAIWLIETGDENSYYENEFGIRFYCKNYPDTGV